MSDINLSRRTALLGGGLLLAGCGGGGGDSSASNVTLPPGQPAAPTPTPSPPPVGAGSRILGISPTEREDEDFQAVTDAIRSAGVGNATISLAWDDIEVAPGRFAPDPNFAAIANEYYPANGLSLTVVLVGIDTTADRRPADLQGRPYDDPDLIARYRAVQQWVLDEMADVEITAWSIGNEIDALLGSDRAAWQAWRRLVAAAAPDVRAVRPDCPVGSKVTSNVLDNPVGREEYGELLKEADANMQTYYPAGPDFDSSVLPAVADDFDRMLNAYPDLPLRLLECGFSSSPILGSSEALQADFVSAVFAAWDQRISSMPQLDYFAVHDFSPDAVNFYRDYYGLDDDRFAAFLGHLGLRRWTGEAKAGWDRFVAEAAARGFG